MDEIVQDAQICIGRALIRAYPGDICPSIIIVGGPAMRMVTVGVDGGISDTGEQVEVQDFACIEKLLLLLTIGRFPLGQNWPTHWPTRLNPVFLICDAAVS